MPRPKVPASPFRYFNSSPEIIRLTSVHKYYNTGCHLVDRDTYKQRRSAALAKWRWSWAEPVHQRPNCAQTEESAKQSDSTRTLSLWA